MSFQTPTDVSVIISTPTSTSTSDLATERRITPSWTIPQLKGKLETVTGVPPSSQRLLFKSPGRPDQWIEGGDEKVIGEYGLARGCEIEVHDSRPPAARPNFSDLSSVEKYELPSDKYESLSNSVLAWKKAQKLGRFDPKALSPEELLHEQVAKDRAEIEKKDIKLLSRAIILPSSPPHIRRGTIRYIGPVPEIPFAPLKSAAAPSDMLQPLWVGIELDEPTGKNDGSIAGRRYFECAGSNRGVFVKPEKVEVGDFPPLDLELGDDDDMEEI